MAAQITLKCLACVLAAQIPWENRNDRTPEMAELAERIDGEAERLEGLLDAEGKALLEKLLDDASDLECRAICEGFKDGFRLGAQITAASMEGLKKP